MFVVNEKCLVKIDRNNPKAIYATLGCGVQSGAGTILNVLKPKPNETVVVFGLGSVGLTALMAAAYLGAFKVIAVDIQGPKLESALELGATHALNSRGCANAAEKIKEMTSGGADYALECTGIPGVIETAVGCLGPTGTAAVVGVPLSNSKIQIDPLAFLLDNKELIGVIEGDSRPKEISLHMILSRNKAHVLPRLLVSSFRS